MPLFVPDIRLLDRAATAEDVKAGKAIFHLDRNAKRADLKLPAVGARKSDAAKTDAALVLIMQAESGPGGVVYGIITRTEIRSIAASELTDINSFADLEREE